MGLVAKAFQDIITFSRGSPGWYVNSNGYITQSSVLNYLTYSNQPENAAWTKSNSFVQQNLLTYSQEFDNAAWLKSNAGVGTVPTVTANQGIAPDGTLTADRIQFDCGNAGSATNRSIITPASVSQPSGVNYAGAFYIKAFDASNVGKTIRFAIDGTASNVFTLTADWQRVSITGLASTALTNFLIETRGTFTGQTADLLLWGAQLVQGSVPGDYRATTSAALPCLYADYNGALRSRQIVRTVTAASESGIQQTGSALPAGTSMTLSVVAKTGNSGNYLYLRNIYVDGNLPAGVVTFDLATGTIVYTGSTYTGKASIVSAGNGFYRCSITGNVASSPVANRIDVGLTTSNSGGVGGTLGDFLYIADAQLNDGSSALAYYDTTASAYNAPRFDYDPVTLAAKGLLVEESRANLLTYSNDWSNVIWNKTNITRTPSATLGPDGTFSMTKLEATSSTFTNCNQQITATATSHTYSIYAKKGSAATDANFFAIYNSTTATTLAQLSINYDTGVVTQTTGTGATATAAGNNIWRIVIPVTSGITVGNVLNCYSCYLGGTETAGEFAYVYGAQVEAGAFATSYIPTVASQVTRAADVASVNTLSPWFNQAAGTFYGEFDVFGVSGSANILGDGAAGTSIAYLNTSFNLVSYNGVSGPTTGNATSANTIAKASLAYATNSRRAVLNAGTASNQTGDLQVLTKLELGKAFGNTYLNGHLRRVTFYPRQFTAAEQQTLTTL